MSKHDASARAKPISQEENPYLNGEYAPVRREVFAMDLPVQGALPPELCGRLLRQGPNPAAVGASHHWFLGDGMTHAIHLEAGHARSYANRWVRTPSLAAKLDVPHAPRSPHSRTVPSLANIHVIQHAGRILALGEVGLPYELDTKLETLVEYDFGGALKTNMTAHPKIDPVTGELVFFGYDFGPVHLRYHTASAGGTLTRTVEVDLPQPAMLHDFAVTQTRVVFMDLPVVFDPSLLNRGHAMPFRWDPAHPARLGVMPRSGDTGQLTWLPVDPCYVYHVVNAYDDEERIVLDVVRHERTFDQSHIGPEDTSTPSLVRWTLDPTRGRVDEQRIDARPQEFPRVDPRRETLSHRYAYTALLGTHGPLRTVGLLKHDLRTGESWHHEASEGRTCSEPVFAPTGPGEDEGYVLSIASDRRHASSELWVLDAQRFDAPPVAVIPLPQRVPLGFHGSWIPEAAASSQ